MDKSSIGLLPYTSDMAPINGEAKNCKSEKRDPINPVKNEKSQQLGRVRPNKS